jgi:uncharacterized integral membrane protein (TIGR02327 family)
MIIRKHPVKETSALSPTDNMAYTFALSSIGYIVLSLVCIVLAWWGLQQFRFDLFLKNPRSAQSKVLQIFLSVALGYGVARFIMDYFNWSALLKGMF